MAVKETPPYVSLSLFTASKQIRFLENLKALHFSVELVLTDPSQASDTEFFQTRQVTPVIKLIVFDLGGLNLALRIESVYKAK